MRDPDTTSPVEEVPNRERVETRLRVRVIFNPNAGLSRRGLFQRTLDELDALGCDVWLHRTDGAGDAETIARELPACDRLVVAGGDGTMHEAINGLRGRELPVALIPLGTANVLAREIGLRRDPRHVAHTIVHGRPQSVHLGEVNGRLFVQMMGVGFDARVVDTVSRPLKRRVGQWAFVLAFVQVVLRYGRPRYAVTGDGAHAGSTPFVVVANGRYYGGAFLLAPDARLDHAGLHACLFTTGGIFAAIRYGLALVTNRLPHQRDVVVQDASVFTVDGPAGDPIQADGEVVGRLPAEVRTVPDAATLVVPNASRSHSGKS
jgi:YegS/Rv2252/BmrU family lipid kinase